MAAPLKPQIGRIVAMAKLGMTDEQIAERIGTSKGSIEKFRRFNSIPSGRWYRVQGRPKKHVPAPPADAQPYFSRTRAEAADAAFAAAIGARRFADDPRVRPVLRLRFGAPATRSAPSSLAGAMW